MRIVIAATLALFATPALSNPLCVSSGELAATIMENRQSGIVMSRMMDIADNVAVPAVGALTRELVLQAYSVPQYSSQSYRINAVAEFRNQVEYACYLGLGR